ncbi:hypothetical protein B0H19DRAFT_1067917 [Mycena capillaripes]|nr:hypothetical protein B0H19DRAFT_1067917 [Mycena capillaripes]
MERWQEQEESKLAELRTTVRSFGAYKNTWTQMATNQQARDPKKIGHIAYSKQKAKMFTIREQSMCDVLKAYPEYACLDANDADLVVFVTAAHEEDGKVLASVLESARAAAAMAADED